jgi:hypothetical protein
MLPSKYVDGQTGHGTVAKEEAVQTAGKRAHTRTWTPRKIIRLKPKLVSWRQNMAWDDGKVRDILDTRDGRTCATPSYLGRLILLVFTIQNPEIPRAKYELRIKMRTVGLDSCSAWEILKALQPPARGRTSQGDPSPNQGFLQW